MPRGRSFAEWREIVRFRCGRLHVTRLEKNEFRGEMKIGRLGNVQASLITADPHTVIRPHRRAESSDEEFVYFCGVLAGQAEVTQDNRVGLARAGDIVAFDSARPFRLSMATRFRMMVLKIPHNLIGVTPPVTVRLTARVWTGARGVAALVSPLLFGLAAHMHEFDAATAQQLGCSLTSLVATLFSEELRRNPADPAAGRHALLLRVQAYIREHLANAELTPRLLAKRHHISVRYLQKLFREQGMSPASYIRDERLKRCAADLRDPRLAHLPVSSIGERWGLSTASHFSHLFRERFGVSPQEYRRLEHVPPILSVDGDANPATRALIA